MKSKYFWKDDEIDVIKKLGSKLNAKDLKKKIPNKSIVSIYHKRRELGIKAPGVAIEWTEKEINILKKFGNITSANKLLKKLPGKSLHNIHAKRKKLNIKVNIEVIKKKATKAEDEIILKNKNLKVSEIVKLLKGRERSFVLTRMKKLKINKRDIIVPFPKSFLKWYNIKLNNNQPLDKISFTEYQKKRDLERAEQLEKDRKKDNQIIFNVVEPIRKDPNRGMRFVNCSEPINKGRLGHSKAFLYKANKTYKYYD